MKMKNAHDILKGFWTKSLYSWTLKIEQYEVENISFSKIISSIKDNFEIISIIQWVLTLHKSLKRVSWYKCYWKWW